jgi:hypothetical protein
MIDLRHIYRRLEETGQVPQRVCMCFGTELLWYVRVEWADRPARECRKATTPHEASEIAVDDLFPLL